MRFLSYILISLSLVFVCSCAVEPKRYQCVQNTCVQQPVGSTNGNGLAVCRMLCGSGSLWPLPKGTRVVQQPLVSISLNNIQFSNSQPAPVTPLVNSATNFFLQTLQSENAKKKVNTSSASTLKVVTTISSSDITLNLGTNESYALSVRVTSPSEVVANIQANTFFGMRHGLETLSQLIVHDETISEIVIASNVQITDAPKYTYRGILLDTSRNFYSMDTLKKTIDAMSFNKLNTFHWHMTDTGSFPIESEVFPQMNVYGAYSPEQIYTTQDVVDFIAYSLSRGVRVVPELDAPAHAGNGWQWGPSAGMGDLAFCINQAPWRDYCVEPPCGQLNPLNANTQKVLTGLYKEIVTNFGNPSIFHMGGDEVNYGCWNSSQEILNWLQQHNMSRDANSFLELWGGFQVAAFNNLRAAKNDMTAILWSSQLTNTPQFSQKYLPKENYIIEVWDPSDQMTVPNLLQLGYKIIVANYDAWYLDCGFGAWIGSGVNWCSPFKEWQRVYNNCPYKSLAGKWEITDPAQLALIQGGEVAMWSEQADDSAFYSKVWPRGAAIAERLWSDLSTDWSASNDRMQFHRHRLVGRGVQVEGLQPLWCLQNQGGCL